MRARILMCALALVAAGCGGDGADTTEAPSTTGAAATTAAPTTTEAATTTTAAATTTTEDPMAAVAAEVAPFEGGYTGTWNNTTFGSEGEFIAEVSYDAAAMEVAFTVDLGGFVFGASDPEPETFVVPLADLAAAAASGSMTIMSSTFGEMQVTVGDGGLEMYSDTVPDPGIATISVTGSFTPDGFELDYVIEFTGSGGAEGTVTVQKAG
ncbi:MAG: hypothetical protein KQH83_08370 [Actinobacteria bacterium]|nr:hypothetical protein [Actinomycetota bacterium]